MENTTEILIPWDLFDERFNIVRIDKSLRIWAYEYERGLEIYCDIWVALSSAIEITDLVTADMSGLNWKEFKATRQVNDRDTSSIRFLNACDEEELINDFEKELNLLIAGSFGTTRNLVIDLLKKFIITKKGD